MICILYDNSNYYTVSNDSIAYVLKWSTNLLSRRISFVARKAFVDKPGHTCTKSDYFLGHQFMSVKNANEYDSPLTERANNRTSFCLQITP